MNETLIAIIMLAIGFAAFAAGFILKQIFNRKLKSAPDIKKKLRIPRLLSNLLMYGGGWYFAVKLLQLIFGNAKSEGMSVELMPARTNLFGISISMTSVFTWIAMAVIIIAAVLIRIFVIPKMSDKPHGIQRILEIIIEQTAKYTESKTSGHLGENLGAYIFSTGALLIACASFELFRLRAPTSDLTMTISLALVTFLLINYYGLKEKKLSGRIKSLASPTPFIMPIRIICDLAIPVSMACRLFGNMLGGMIVMDLLYSALGNYSVAIPSIFGLYFNFFHPLIQAFIFITLTLAFINEATE